MPRKPRLEVEGLCYHVIARGIERRQLFKEREDYRFFLDHLSEVLVATQIDCYAFCLMPNHLHLLLKQKSIPISRAMRRLLTRYALYFNKKYRRSGHLFQNRYKAIICQEEPYLLELIRYIHLNPVRAKIASTMEELSRYPFSGHALLIGRKNCDWFAKDRVLSHFGKGLKKAREAYLAFIVDGLAMGKDPRYTGGGLKRSLGYPEEYPRQRQAFDDRILGDGDFVLSLQQLEEADGRRSDLTIEQLIDKAAEAYSLDIESIRGNKKTKALCEARALTAYLASVRLGLSFAETARHLNVNRSSVARMAERGRRIAESIDIEKWLMA